MSRFCSVLNSVLFPSKKTSILVGIVLSLLVPLTFLLVYQTGGIKFVYSHTMYIPIVLIGVIFGLKWGILTAIIGGILLSPLMPIDTITGEEQELANWLYRTLIFVFIGALSGYFSDTLRKRQRDHDLQLMHRNILEFLQQVNEYANDIVLYGAGEVAQILINTIKDHPSLSMNVVAIIDDNPKKIGTNLLNIPIIKLDELKLFKTDAVLITAYGMYESMYKKLVDIDFDQSKIYHFFN